jgi:hypothetical protein
LKIMSLTRKYERRNTCYPPNSCEVVQNQNMMVQISKYGTG